MLPEFSLGPFVSLPTYYLYLSLLVSVMFYVTWRWAQREKQDPEIALNLALLITLSGFIGGRLLHVLFEAPDFYRRFPLAIFKFWLGGYVFFGGLITSAVTSFIYLRFKKQSFWHWFDFLTPLLALSYGLGRGACFLAGCCYGSYCDLPWAVAGRHPTQLYALALELLIALFLFRCSRLAKKWPAGTISSMWLSLHSLSRLFMESYRADFRGEQLAGLSLSTWISLGLFSFSLAWLTRLWMPRLIKGIPSSKK